MSYIYKDKKTKAICNYITNTFTYGHFYDNFPNNIATHTHHCYELFYLVDGEITYNVEGQSYHLKANDLIFTNNRELHRILNNNPNIYERRFIQFKPEYVLPLQNSNYNLLNFLENRKLGKFNKLDSCNVIKYGINNLWDEIEYYCSKDLPESEIMLKTLLVQLLIKLNNIFKEENQWLNNSILSDNKVNSILEYLNSSLSDHITLDLLSNKFYMDKFYLCHIFKETTGFSVMEYLTYKRIMKSQELLSIGLSALDASIAVGFSDYSNFYKSFKKSVGISPRAYSKANAIK